VAIGGAQFSATSGAESRPGLSLWEALAGRAPGQPAGHADPGLWHAVAERLNPARARPQLRKGIEHQTLATARGDTYVMLRSPDQLAPCYVRLTPDEWQLAQLFTGQHTVARLIAEFARISGRLAPEQVIRVVADLAANRMLHELPVDAFKPLERLHRKPWPVRLGRGIVSALRGRRVILAGIDPLITGLYKAGARVLQGPRGRGVQMNHGAAHARGEVLLFLHADTRLPTEAHAAITAACADPALAGGCFRMRFDRDGTPLLCTGSSP